MESFSMPCYTEKTGVFPPLPATNSKPASETFGRPTGEHQASNGIPTVSPRMNQHNSPLGRLTPLPPNKKQQQLNNKQGTEN
jgi:hypothetical protein